jgi:pimeloyl-ACP methyl ester carboxylesterase
MHLLIKRTLRSVATTRRIATSRTQLPPAQTLPVGGNYALKYIDIRPTTKDTTEKKPTLVLIHGAPGSFRDFKYLIPLLQDKARIIGVNLPGNGESQVIDHANYYDNIDAIKVHRSAYDALVQLCGDDEDVFVLGHSFGGHATINLTAFNQDERKLNIRGVALVASAGLRPHKAMHPRSNAILTNLLRSKVAFIEQCAREFTRLIYVKVLGFPANASTEHFVAGIVRCATTDFNVIKQHVQRIRNVPAFFAWAKDDAFMEEEIFTELSQQCHPGPRLAFDNGGHNIQKTKAPLLAEELLQWTRAVINGSGSGVITQPRTE